VALEALEAAAKGQITPGEQLADNQIVVLAAAAVAVPLTKPTGVAAQGDPALLSFGIRFDPLGWGGRLIPVIY
jgi:hypothetical protein